MFSLLIGAFLAYLRHSGGVSALVEKLVNSGLAGGRRVGRADDHPDRRGAVH